jgi:WD40 repeat protein
MRRAFRVAALALAISTGAAVAAATAAGPASGAAVRAGASHGAGAQPPGGSQLWRAVYGKDRGGSAVAVAVSPDSSRVYVTGSATGPGGHSRIATVAYQAATGRRLWVATYHGPVNTDTTAAALTVSPDGQQVFVTGSTFGQHITRRGVTLAYNAATGATMWTAINPSGRPIYARAVAVSPDGSTVFSVSSDGVGMVTIAYDAASGATDWSQEYTGPQSGGGAYAVAVSPDGSTVFVAGYVAVQTSSDYEYATVAYQAGTGTMRWAQVLNGASGSLGDESLARSIAVSPDGSTVFVTGILSTTAGESYGTLAYDASTGTRRWLELYQTSSNDNEPAALAVSPDGAAVFVTGYAGASYATVAYAAATGAQQWADLYHPAQGAAAKAVAVSPDSATVFVTGDSSKAGQSTHYATFAYAAATGATRWRQFYPGPGYPSGYGQGNAVAVSPDGSAVFVTGLLQNPLNQPSEYGTFAYQP